MPPKVRFTKDDLLDAGLAIARRGGLEAINARALARELGCSTQPIFRAFDSMERVRAGVLERARAEYARFITGSAGLAATPYKAAGLAYVSFAREEPELFRMLFMCDQGKQTPAEDQSLGYVLDALVARTGFTRERAEAFHLKQWVFVHGLAAMAATRYGELPPERLDALLTEQFEASMLYERQRG